MFKITAPLKSENTNSFNFQSYVLNLPYFKSFESRTGFKLLWGDYLKMQVQKF